MDVCYNLGGGIEDIFSCLARDLGCAWMSSLLRVSLRCSMNVIEHAAALLLLHPALFDCTVTLFSFDDIR